MYVNIPMLLKQTTNLSKQCQREVCNNCGKRAISSLLVVGLSQSSGATATVPHNGGFSGTGGVIGLISRA